MQGRACASVSTGCAAPALDADTAETAWRCRCASPARAWGVFSGRRVVWWELSVVPGDVLAGGGGSSDWWAAPSVFYVVSFVQSPGRSRTAARRVRGAAEACVSSRRLRVGFSFSCSLALWPLAFWLTLPLDLDLTCLQRRRYHKEHLQLKRCRALSSAHDNDFHILLQQLSSAPQP